MSVFLYIAYFSYWFLNHEMNFKTINDSNPFILFAADQIQFTKRIQNIVVNERQSATFECELAFDNAVVTWYKDAWELKESPKYTFRCEGRRHFMIIRNVTSEDEGVYI